MVQHRTMQQSLLVRVHILYNELGRRVATISFGKAQKDYTGGIAIGTKTYAITGGTSIGQRDYNGVMGDVTVSDGNRDYLQYAPGATSLGSNAYAGGTLATVIGAYNISSSGYNGTGGLNSAYYVAQNLGSTILGTLNSNESASAKDTALRIGWPSTTITPSSSGIANSIVGVANTVKNSNGSIVLGAGNTVSNSSTKIVDDITGSYSELKNWQPTSYKSVNDMAQDLRDKVKSSKSGGSTLVIGGGNTADYTQRTQIIGVNNTVTGTEETPSDYNMINAFGTEVTNSSHLYTIGDNNHITDTNRTIVFGDNRYVSTTNDSIIIGSSDKSDKPQYTTATDATIIGHNANAWGNRGMALGKDVYTTGDDSVAIGSAVAAYSKNSIAIGSSDGFYKTAVTDYSKDKPTEGGIAIGMGTLTNASHGTAIGYHAMVTNVDGYALGSKASVSADKGVAIGYQALATNAANALALGTKASASGLDNIAIGTGTIATGSSNDKEHPDYGQRTALGAYSNASGQASSAIGSGVNVNGNYSVGIGSHDAKGIYASTNVSGDRAVGIGVQANVAGESAVGIGDTAIANGKQAVAIGKNANASNEDAFAFGTSANSSRQRALALGASANANHEDSVALGTSALAAGDNALALGTNANVSGNNGIAIGASVTEQDENKHVKSSMAVAENSTAIGTAASATGKNSIVIGSYEMNQDGTVKNAQAVARDSMAFGTAANAWGQEGIAFGKDTGAGQNAIAIGSNANAWKSHSTAIGNSAVGGAEYGVAIGEGAIVTNRYKDNGSGKYVEDTEHPATDAVAIGHNALTNVKGGVALGAGSVSSLDSGVLGYDPSKGDHSKDTSGIWKSTAAAVSVGDASKNITRQITNVAAGKEDTDAVNVAQLKAISSTMNTDIAASKTHFYSVNSTDEKAGNYDNKGATAANALAAGVGANADKASAVAIGDTAYAGSANGVAIGTGSWIRSSNGNKPNANGGDVAIGQDSHVDSYVNQGGSIALGQNARVENTNGSTERKYAFGQTRFEGDNIPLNPGNEAGGVAIGRNSFARTGSLMVGSHMYKGAIADMDEVDGTDSQKLRDNFNNINMTTLGTNSFNNGTFATVTGSYSATTANPKKKIQNFAATIDGSLNSIESYKYQDKDAADNSGVASSIVGTANRIANSNNTTILGAGNEVTNSLTDFTAPTEGGASAKALQDTLKDTLQKDAKGAVVISGIGNKVDSSHGVSVLGSKNVVNATDNIQLLGDNREVTGATGSVIIGSADSKTATSVKGATILGHNANVSVEGGVALGAGSAASIDKDQHGYNFLTKAASTSDEKEWKSSWAAVSVGDAEHTRQITNLAAGFNDTDAVNVAQLKNVMNMPVHIYSGGTINTTGTQITNNMTISNLQLDFGDGLKAQEVDNNGDKRVLVTLDKDTLKNDPAFKGPKGDKGDTGTQGPKGDKGNTGVQGPKGDKGDAGVQGSKGDKGDTGAQGPKGDKGDTGAQGQKGDKGDTGAQGQKGDKGDTGAQGPKGDKGDTGAQGPKGDKGDAGVQGPKGDKGDTGAQGPAGKDGKDGKDGGVGTVTDDGSNITVTNTETDSTKPANYQVSLKKDINIDSVTADKVTAKEMTTDRLTINKDVSIEQGSKNAVNAGTVYNETRVKQDGKYVKASNTAGENLSMLDNQVASNSSNITNLNGRVNNLDSKVNKVGAGAAALAALHPLDFDPEDKWDFAVGYGNYRDANSVAVGAFYRPDDDTMFSVGTNFGNGENMINAGVSFKFGPKGKSQVRPGSTQEITELRATVARQDDQLKKQDSEIKELKAMVQQLMAKQDKQATTK